MTEPRIFQYYYKNDTHPGESVEDSVDLSTTKGHTYRDFKAKHYLFFEDIQDANIWIGKHRRPYIHSVVNKYQKIRFSLELDMNIDLLDKIILAPAIIKQIEDAGFNVNYIKAMNCFVNVQDSIIKVLGDNYLIDYDENNFDTAEDHRENIKYSYRIYAKLAFTNMNEYKHFITLLKKEVKPCVIPMLDPTKSHLRMPGSWKEEKIGKDHRCQWVLKDEYHTIMPRSATLSFIDDCDVLDEIAPPESLIECDDMPDGDIKKAVAIISTHPSILGNFYYVGVDKGFLKLKRAQPSHCDICKRTHDVSDAYATIYRGHVDMRCYRDDTKGTIYIGYIGEPEKMDLKFSSVKTIMKNLELQNKKLNMANMSNTEKKQMSEDASKIFDELKEKAKGNDELLEQKDKFYFSDFLDFHEKLFSDYTQFNRYVKQTIAKIINGGNSLFITGERLFTRGSHYLKDEETYTRKFTELPTLPCSKPTEAYELSIINPSFDITQPIDKNNSMIITKKFCDIINKYTMRNFYKTVDFIPYLLPPAKENLNVFNMFEGFRFPYQEQKDVPETVKPWINHILEVVCSGNKEQAKILTQWMAHIIQKPTEKAFCVILYGGQGSGKSILYELFTQCVGRNYCLQVGKLEDLTQTHNPHVIGKLLVNCNECTNEPTTRDVNIMKGLITEIEMLCNPKNVNPYTISVYSRFLITSNYKRCMRLDKDDRRYFCLATLNHRQNDDAYFKPLIESIHDDQTQRDFFDYLANYDISDFKCQRPPISKMKRELIGASVDNVVLFIKDVCENNVNGIPFPANQEGNKIFSPIIELYAKYDMWVKENDSKGRKSSRESLRDPLEQYLKIKETKRGARGNQKKGFEINRVELLPHFRDAFANPKFDYAISNPAVEFEANVVVADEE